MSEIVCPSCGTVSHFDQMRRAADEFCRRCDYPLFWATARVGGGFETDGDGETAGLRRLPGAAGRVTAAAVGCPECDEPNLLTALVCIRCGADLNPPPPPPPVEEPPPPPPPPVIEIIEPPPPRPIWPYVAVLVALPLILLVLFLVLS